MAISTTEDALRAETRTTLLNAIKKNAELVNENSENHGHIDSQSLHRLAEAYALVTGGAEKQPGKMRSF